METRVGINASDELRRLSMEMMEMVAKLNAVALHLDLAPYTGLHSEQVSKNFVQPVFSSHPVEVGATSKSKLKRVRRTPGNHHKKWSAEDHSNLQILIKDGNSRTTIAKLLERTPHAILCKQRQLAMQKLNEGSSIEEVILWSGLNEEELEKSNSWRSSSFGKIMIRNRNPPSPSEVPKMETSGDERKSSLGSPRVKRSLEGVNGLNNSPPKVNEDL